MHFIIQGLNGSLEENNIDSTSKIRRVISDKNAETFLIHPQSPCQRRSDRPNATFVFLSLSLLIISLRKKAILINLAKRVVDM